MCNYLYGFYCSLLQWIDLIRSCLCVDDQASLAAEEKWDQAKQGVSDLAGSVQEKAGHASDKAGSMLGSVNAAQSPS